MTTTSERAYTVTTPGDEALTEKDRREYWAVYSDDHVLSGHHAYAQQPYTVHTLRQETSLHTLHTFQQEGGRELRHTPRHVRQSDDDACYLFMHLAGEPLLSRRGDEEMTVGPGTATLITEGNAFDLRVGTYRGVVLKMPGREVSDRLSSSNAPLEAAFKFDTGLGKLIRDMTRSLYEERDHITQPQFDAVCEHLADLLCMLLIGDRCPAADLRTHVEAQARQYIRTHAAEQDLSLPAVASALGWSPRRLQEVMTGAGTSYRMLVREERLAHARRMLGDALEPLTVSGIAVQCGFPSADIFHRQFRARYGESPRGYRCRVRGQ